MESTTLPCCRCGFPVEVIPTVKNLANQHGVYCASCLDNCSTAFQRSVEESRRAAVFKRICPPCFDDTDPAKLPCPSRSSKAAQWHIGTLGLNLWGYPNTGKTRTMSLILKREALAGRSIIALSCAAFREQCEARNYHRGPWLKRLATVDILFIDDFDKQNLTRGMEKDLFGVLNTRMGRLPVMTTGNTKGDTLEMQFSLGISLVDRIRRYCVSIHFGDDDRE